MLALDDPYWAELETHFGSAAYVPGLLAKWQAGLGGDEEDAAYEALFDPFLHQLTIMSCAYAVVPYLVRGTRTCKRENRLEYLFHVGRVEACRPESEAALAAKLDVIRGSAAIPADLREHFLAAARARAPFLPERLAADYAAALDEARALAVAILHEQCELPRSSHADRPQEFARVLGAIASLFSRTEMSLAYALFHPDALSIEQTYDGRGNIASILSDRVGSA